MCARSVRALATGQGGITEHTDRSSIADRLVVKSRAGRGRRTGEPSVQHGWAVHPRGALHDSGAVPPPGGTRVGGSQGLLRRPRAPPDGEDDGAPRTRGRPDHAGPVRRGARLLRDRARLGRRHPRRVPGDSRPAPLQRRGHPACGAAAGAVAGDLRRHPDRRGARSLGPDLPTSARPVLRRDRRPSRPVADQRAQPGAGRLQRPLHSALPSVGRAVWSPRCP